MSGATPERRAARAPAGPRSVGGRRLGELEAQILEVLWRQPEPLGVRELLPMLAGAPRAYTTVVTVLTRLVNKGLVERVGDGRRFLYRAAGDPDELSARAIEEILVAARDRHAVLAHLVAGLDDPALLEELARFLAEPSP